VTGFAESLAGLSAGTRRGDALLAVRRLFTAAGLDSPALDARILVGAALGVSAHDLVLRPETPVGAEGARQIADFARRRLGHEPVARILGEREFWGMPFRLSPETLVPRPDTETVVRSALAALPDRSAPLTVLDLGTGSGCLLIALLHEFPAARGLGTDRSEGALRTARANAARNGVLERALFARCDWATAVRGPFGLVVSNPPYIATRVVESLAPEVREHDPGLALDGGPDGLDAYRAILAAAASLVAPDGLLTLEIGFDQADSVAALARQQGLAVSALDHDLSGQPRCLALKWA
jgi:release factor glutamine methyltransferase